ncbi:MAG: hypothetical protein JXM73_26325 [Anaerolineae bacterium]|nr:hypothetical protein [Anaerolineae bacterium]
MNDPTVERATWNRCRFRPGDPGGHYESYFQRANHPCRPLAFWIRYTVFSPQGRPDDAVGELWAIYFDGEAGRIAAAKEVVPIGQCALSAQDLDVRIGEALLKDGQLESRAKARGDDITWSLQYEGGERPLLLLPPAMYEGGFPKAKALVGTPQALYRGSLSVNGQAVEVDGWVGSQNHNWGSRHTDRYAWGQVAGFDGRPDAFLECSTARVRLGPLWTPWLTLIVLRVEGQEFALNSLLQSVRAHGRFGYFSWSFDSQAAGVRVRGQIEAPASAFVGLRYDNPPGGHKTCLNTKLAACRLTLERAGQPPLSLSTRHRAAFEILTDDQDHGVPVVL